MSFYYQNNLMQFFRLKKMLVDKKVTGNRASACVWVQCTLYTGGAHETRKSLLHQSFDMVDVKTAVK